ncbi:MAG: ATP-dependent 6-phosphofructokinase [Pirellulales bacterium]
MRQEDLVISSLGPCGVQSPLLFDSPSHGCEHHFVPDSVRLRCCLETGGEATEWDNLSYEEAGPRERLFFDPPHTTAAVVTCGGLSPGLNNVIRSIFYELKENYRARRVLGIRNGYLGLNPASGLPSIELDYDFVSEIHKLGGTVLGTSRGPQDPAVIVDTLESAGVDLLLCLGGDGTQRGAHAIHEEVQRRGRRIAIVGLPKTIDNDIPFVRQTFGYVTALEKASEVIRGAHVEARSVTHGIGLVKLMGRDAGFIAAGATLVSPEVNFCLVPEIPFPLDGDNGFLPALAKRMRERCHAVVVVAEGAGQHLFDEAEAACDASGNRLHRDIGPFLRTKIIDYFRERELPVVLKYLDPSYLIRSVPADVYDRFLSDQMGRHAVHAAMAGKTGLIIGMENDRFIHVPIPTVVARTKRVEMTGDLWRSVLQVTRQPRW